MLYVSHVSTIPIEGGVENERRTKRRSLVTPAKKVGLVARTFLMTTGHVSADFLQGTPSVRKGVVRPDKFGIDPTAVDGKR